MKKRVISAFLAAGLLFSGNTLSFAAEKGDINGDGKINAKDALVLLKLISAGKTNQRYDINGDKKVNSKDALELLRMITGMPSAVTEAPKEPDGSELSSNAPDWDYPIGSSKLTYNFKSAPLLKKMEENYAKSGARLGYFTPWCAFVIGDFMRELGYKIGETPTPCDVVVETLNAGYGEFFCFREGNYQSLLREGLKNTKAVKMTSRSNYAPKRGDIVIFLWTEKIPDGINWSHIGIMALDYDKKGCIYTIEGNVGDEYGEPDPDHLRQLLGKKREYNETVVGILRLTK